MFAFKFYTVRDRYFELCDEASCCLRLRQASSHLATLLPQWLWPALGMEARRAGRAARVLRSALQAGKKGRKAPFSCRESPPPALAGERPELNNVSRAAVDQRDSIHNAWLIPPCIIGKMGGGYCRRNTTEGLAPLLVGCFEPLHFFSKIMDGTIDNSSAFVYILQ